MDRTSQLATDGPVQDHVTVVLDESSQSVMLIDNLESTNLRVLDTTVPGFHVTGKSVAEMATATEEKVAEREPPSPNSKFGASVCQK
jgi:hypothetical protein